jgi:chemotaxis protein methyltransferase CheR
MMGSAIMRADVERFRGAVARRIGLQFDEGRLAFLGDVMGRRLNKLGRASECYLSSLEQEPCSREWSALARELTVGETYFFRNHEQFRALAEVALPARIAAKAGAAGPKVLRLLSAGCASGEEAYTMAIVARETVADPSLEIAIQAVDLNPAALERAARARYSAWSLRATPPDVQRKWFRPDGGDLVLDDAIRCAVKFCAANLAGNDPEQWQPAAYDVVFCRNVLMYFSPEQMRAAIARIAGSLAPGGFLFLGHAETLRGLSDAFHLRHTHGTFYYERRSGVEPAPEPALAGPPPRLPIPAAAMTVAGEAWFDAIRRASERVVSLTAAPSPVEAPAGAPAASPPDLAPLFELLRREKFAEALDCVRARPAGRDADALLLEATLLAHDGQLAAAEDTCLRLLALDGLNAGAHYVLALCRDHCGQRDRAAEHDRIAAHLDPGFAMPCLHLGLMARRAGDRDGARREFGHALVLLRREDPARLLLFGGGFTRAALIALCESALRENGSRP